MGLMSKKTAAKVEVTQPVRGTPISVPWKSECKERHSSLKKKRTTNYNFSTWDRRQELRKERARIKQMEKDMKEQKETEIEEKKQRREENERRRLENERKAEQVQTITSSRKLKKMSKKQWRQIEKR